MDVRVVIIAILAWALLAGSVCAQTDSEVSISAEAHPSEVGTEETVRIRIEVTGVPLSAIETPEPPSTTNLVLEDSDPAPRRELSFDSGSLTRRVTFEWAFRPLRVGFGRVHPATVHIRGKRYRTDEIRVRVVPQSQRPSPAPRPSRVNPPRTPQAGGKVGIRPRDLFIRAEAPATTVYQNQQVTVEYRLFFRPGVRLRQSRMADAWDAPGFWREELDVASRPTPRPTQAYGERYETIVLKRVALFPTRVGTLAVDPLRIETEAQSDSGPGGARGGGRTGGYEPVTLSSEEVRVVSDPLPPDPPPSFDGAVGQFALDTSVTPDSADVGDAVELTVRIQGAGNLATVSPPVVDVPADIDAYDPNVDLDIDRSGDRVRGTKTFTYTLVPQSNGRYTLPPVRFSYFDAEAGQYRTERSEPTSLPVSGDVPPRAMSQTGQGLPIGDIAGPMTEEVRWVRADPVPLYRQPWTYAVVLASVVLAAGGALYRRYAAGGPVVTNRVSEGLEEAQGHLQDAHHQLRDGDVQRFYSTVERAVLTFLGARLDLSRTPAGMTRDALDRRLDRSDVEPSDREALFDLLDACDEAQFTPQEPSHESMEATLDHTQRLLLHLDDVLPASTSSTSSS